jgi:signal transduction histidine kinase
VKSLRLRLTLWFGFSFVAVVVVFGTLTYQALDLELRRKSIARDYPTHPGWRLHGSFSKEEVRDIMTELMENALVFSLPLVALALGMGYWLARKSVAPIARVNEQLRNIQSRTLQQRITLAEADGEFRDLVQHINELLARLEDAFGKMSEYAARVAHELRTHLAILRLKVERSDNRIAPELAEELQDELSRLTHVTEQLLLIAKAEQRRVVFENREIDLSAMLTDLVQDFRLLARENQRELHLNVTPHCWINADPRYLKQILHNLLTNAHRHGAGSVTVRLRHCGNLCSLLIANKVGPHRGKLQTLGLGLRVVQALLNLDSGMKYSVRQQRGLYVARLQFAHVRPSTEKLVTVARTAYDPVI